MESMEKKLANYRTQKRVNQMIQYFKNLYQKMFVKIAHKVETKNNVQHLEKGEHVEVLHGCTPPAQQETEKYCTDEYNGLTFTIIHYLYFTLWFLLWVTLYGIFIKLEFGTVFLIFSALTAMYCNTRTDPKPENEISAYSVFNKDCQCIEGTLDGEKLTREMLYRI